MRRLNLNEVFFLVNSCSVLLFLYGSRKILMVFFFFKFPELPSISATQLSFVYLLSLFSLSLLRLHRVVIFFISDVFFSLLCSLSLSLSFLNVCVGLSLSLSLLSLWIFFFASILFCVYGEAGRFWKCEKKTKDLNRRHMLHHASVANPRAASCCNQPSGRI